jgi:hypothetical protein
VTHPKYGDWLEKLPGHWRVLQSDDKVKSGDYMQIGKHYARIDENDWVLPYYDCSGGPFGTFWREIKNAP